MPEMDPIEAVQSRMAEMLATRERVSTPQDRITKILKRGSEFNVEQHFTDLASAFAAASRANTVGAHLSGRPGKSIGELMSGMRAQRIKEAEAQARLEIEDEKLGIQRGREAREVAQALMDAEFKRGSARREEQRIELQSERVKISKRKERREIATSRATAIDATLKPYQKALTPDQYSTLYGRVTDAVQAEKATDPDDIRFVAARIIKGAGLPDPRTPDTYFSPSTNQIYPSVDGRTHFRTEEPLPTDAFKTPIRIQPTDTSGLSKKDVSELRGVGRRAEGNIMTLSKNLGLLNKYKNAANIRGAIAEYGSGLLSLIPFAGEEAGESFSKFVGGASQAEITDVRTRVRFQTARMLETITQEPSRYTEQDYSRAKEAERTLTPEASWKQIRAATKVAIEVLYKDKRKSEHDLGLDLDPFSDDINRRGREVDKLMTWGFSLQEAVTIVNEVYDMARGKFR